MKRTTIFLPEALHERLRRQAFRDRITMAEIIRRRLNDTHAVKAKRRTSKDDLLLKAAGIASVGGLTERIDEELYGFFRSPIFRALPS